MARRTKAEAAQTREQILEAALKVFSEKGYSKATFVDVAKEIGLSKGAVYWHFKTKPDLLVALIAYGDEMFCASSEDEMVSSVAELRSKVNEFAILYTTNSDAWNFEFLCNFQVEWSTELMAEVHEKLAEMRMDPLKKFEQQLIHLQESGALRRDKGALLLAQCFGSSWVGSLHLALHGDIDRDTFVEVILCSFDLIIGSLATR